MVFKRYIKKRGKRFGPYYYISYRINGIVEKYYIGNSKKYKKWKRSHKFVVQQDKKKEKKLKKLENGGRIFGLLFLDKIGVLNFWGKNKK